MSFETLDDAYDRLRSTGPEFDGWLSNHGPMAAEALARHGHESEVLTWLDGYCRRLDEAPRAFRRIDDWRTALGDSRRLGDWVAWFEEELRERPWGEVLTTWWPRLLPGIAAGATHGVIRVGHTVRVLRDAGETEARVAELAQGLGYWAARWQAVPGASAPSGRLDAAEAVAALPSVPDQTGGINSRLAQLRHTGSWSEAQRALAPSEDSMALLRDVVTASVRRYATHAHGSPVMLVHAATAPNAVLRTLPSLPHELWAPSASAAWSASAAIHAAYARSRGAPLPGGGPATPEEAFDRAAAHGDEHVIKLADTAIDVFEWTGDSEALLAIETALTHIAADQR